MDERADDNFLQRLNHSVTGGIRSGAGFVAEGLRAAVDDYAQDVTKPTRALGQGINRAAQLTGTVVGKTLETAGFEGAAARARENFRKTGQAAQNGVNWVASRNDEFIHGLGESAAGGVAGLASTVTDPVGAAKGVAQLVQQPTLLLEGYKQTAKEYGWAGALGHAAGNVLTTVATGGGGGAAKGASAAGRVSTLTNLGRRATTVDGVAPAVSLNVPSRPRATASRAFRNIVEDFRGNDAEKFARRAEAARAAAPELHADITGVRDRISSVGGRDELQALVDSPELSELARRIDAQSSGNDAVFGLELPVGGEQPALALVTRVGNQTGNAGFHSYAPGGNFQIQFFDSSPFHKSLSKISPDGLSGQVELPAGVEWFSPLPGAVASGPWVNNPFPSGEALRTYLSRIETVGSGTVDVANTFVTPHDARSSEDDTNS